MPRSCSVCGKPNAKRCGNCDTAAYCCKACQKQDWNAGHRDVCKAAVPPEELCPICLDHRHDYSKGLSLAGLCFKCGQLFCGECLPKMQQSVTECPMCRMGFRQMYEERVQLLHALIRREHGYHTAPAQYQLAIFYQDGDGVAQDHTEAARRFRATADQGHAGAQCRLGTCYYKGDGVVQDRVEAVRWYRKAAEQGHANAQCNLGYCYENGVAVKQDHDVAVQWFRKAAKQACVDAQFNLAICYTDATPSTTDDVEAVRWFRAAAEQGHASAQFNIAECYAMGIGVLEDLTESTRWYEAAAGHWDENAQFDLGTCYFRLGCICGEEERYAAAARWFGKAAKEGHPDAKELRNRALADEFIARTWPKTPPATAVP